MGQGHSACARAAAVALVAGIVCSAGYARFYPSKPVRMLAAITHGISVPNILVVHPSVAATSPKELARVSGLCSDWLVRLARARAHAA